MNEEADLLARGTALGGGLYVVDGLLGRGGFGLTYGATDTRLRRRVALKEFFLPGCLRQGARVLPGGALPAEDFARCREQFLEEARALASFSHPGIVRVYGFFEENGTAYMATEFLAGSTLADLLARTGSLPATEALTWIRQVGEALEEVHKAGLVHRDVKPANILVTEERRAVLLDFGAAREFASRATSRLSVTLTPGYAPLEQYAGAAPRGPFTDVYALASTLYHLLTGVPPPESPERASGAALSAPRDLEPLLSEALSRAVVRGLEMDFRRRPATMREFLASLPDPVAAHPAPAGPRQSTVRLEGHRGWVRCVAFSPEGDLVASGSEDRSVRLWALDPPREVARLTGHSAFVACLAFSADGRFLATGSHDRQVCLFDRREDYREVRLAAPATVMALRFVPGGSRLLVGLRDRTVRLWEVPSGREILCLSGHTQPVEALAVHPSGGLVASGCRVAPRIRLWELPGGHPLEPPWAGHPGAVRDLDFSPDGDLLASGSADGTVRLWNVPSGAPGHCLVGHRGAVLGVAFSPRGGTLASASQDQTVRLWDVASGRELLRLEGHTGEVLSVAFSPAGDRLVSGSQDQTVALWSVAGPQA